MKNILKLFVKGILTTIPLWGVIAYLYLFPMNYMDGEYPYWKANKDFISSTEEENYYSTLILGDSVPNGGLKESLLSNRVYNLAVGGMKPVETYYEMMKYLKNHEKPKSVFIAYAPFHFTTNDCWTARTLYFNYLSFHDAKEVNDLSRQLEDDLFYSDEINQDLYSYRLRRPDKYLPALFNGNFDGRKQSNTEGYNKTLSHNGTYVGVGNDNHSNHDPQSLSNIDSFQVDPVNDIYYNKLINLLTDNNIDTYIIQCPFKESCYDEIKPEVYKEFWDYFKNIKNKHPDVIMDMDAFILPDNCFIDAAHLNYYGSARWCHYLSEKYPDIAASTETIEEKAKRLASFIDESQTLEALLEAAQDESLDVKLWASDDSNINTDENISKLLRNTRYTALKKPNVDANGDVPLIQAQIYIQGTSEKLTEKNYTIDKSDAIVHSY